MNLKPLIPWREKSQTPAIREGFFDPLVTFRREVDRMFDDFFNGMRPRTPWPLGNGWQGLTPVIDVTETEKEVVITAELPGVNEKEVEVTIADDLLTIKGEKKTELEQENGDATYMERRFGSFSRSVRLPFEVKDEKVDAKYDKGVLTIRVPKPAEIQKAVRRIEVKAA
ncbi:MAG TPA: Hsp20/alpha crystallin family protein [Hyphomicrobiaceae bacterium]|nr:Hsp20/alpha crystallin family protein [Hyphomicrobiaceae bacterium]